MTEHKYAELASRLRGEIQSGLYAEGHKLPSENELAETTGYSRQTVRQAIGVLERERRVERIQGSGTFVRTRPEKRAQTHNIAIVTTYISEYIFPAILDGMEHELAENGYTSMLSATRNRVDHERRILQMLLEKPIDGLIVEGTKTALPNPNIDLYEAFAQRGIPVVFIHGYYPELANSVYVVADDRAGGRMACEALLRDGHQSIAGIFKSDDRQGHCRYAGFTEALHAAGRSVEDHRVLWYTTENRDSMLASFALQTLAGCTAAVCYNDEIAMIVLDLLRRNHVHVPQQFALQSFDRSVFTQLGGGTFASLEGPKEQLGRLAAQKMIGLLQGRPQQSEALPWRA